MCVHGPALSAVGQVALVTVCPLPRAPPALCGEGAAHPAWAGHGQLPGGEEAPVHGGHAAVPR